MGPAEDVDRQALGISPRGVHGVVPCKVHAATLDLNEAIEQNCSSRPSAGRKEVALPVINSTEALLLDRWVLKTRGRNAKAYSSCYYGLRAEDTFN